MPTHLGCPRTKAHRPADISAQGLGEVGSQTGHEIAGAHAHRGWTITQFKIQPFRGEVCCEIRKPFQYRRPRSHRRGDTCQVHHDALRTVRRGTLRADRVQAWAIGSHIGIRSKRLRYPCVGRHRDVQASRDSVCVSERPSRCVQGKGRRKTRSGCERRLERQCGFAVTVRAGVGAGRELPDPFGPSAEQPAAFPETCRDHLGGSAEAVARDNLSEHLSRDHLRLIELKIFDDRREGRR